MSSLFEEIGGGATVAEFIDTFGGIDIQDVTETDLYSGIPEGGAIDWRDHPGVAVDENNHSCEWVFEDTQHRIADLFEHITNGGTTHSYCEQAEDIELADTEELMEFIAGRLDSM